MTEAARVAAARRWFRTLGQQPLIDGALTIVATPAYPNINDANFAWAAEGARGGCILEALDRHLAPSSPRIVTADALTPPAVEAELALAGFVADPPAIEMVLHGAPVSSHPLPIVVTEPLADAENRTAFDALVRADQAEGLRTGNVTAEIGAGLLALMHARRPQAEYRLIGVAGAPVGYGLTAICPGGLGIIEHLFVLPGHRGRGLMSAFIAEATTRLHAAGCDAVFLDALASATAKRLYASLGFVPVALTRNWVQKAAA